MIQFFSLKRGQIFQVEEVEAGVHPELFKLIDLMKDPVPGFYYQDQLKKTNPPTEERLFEVEKVLQTKKVKGKKFYLCKFLFYPAKFNLWIPEENMEMK